MTWEPTEKLIEQATVAMHDRHCPDRMCEPQTMGLYRASARAMLAAVGPVIAAQALRDAAGTLRADPASPLWEMWHTARGQYESPLDWLHERADAISEASA